MGGVPLETEWEWSCPASYPAPKLASQVLLPGHVVP